MSETDIVLQHLDQGLLTITMNRPERRNALNPEMTRGLVEAARRAAEDHEVRAVLLKGAGGTFCVGGDVKSMAEGRAPLPFEAKLANLRRGMEVSRILHQMPKPVVAQFDGADSRDVTFPTGPDTNLTLKGQEFVNRVSFPNFYFHAAIAHGILRHNGVEVGKRDFLGMA